jgi:hypothetical protein
VLFFGVKRIGYPDLNHQFPALSSLVIAFLLALPMETWMRFRGMDWSHTLEMAATPIVLGILLTGLAWFGV